MTSLSTEYVITPAQKADIGSMVCLLQGLFELEKDFTADPEKQQRGLEMLLLEPERAVVLIARLTPLGEIFGMVTGQLVISTAQGGPSVWVEDLFVVTEMRHCGLGQALLNAVLHWAQERGATRAQLLADTRNTPAISFYSHLGWQRTNMLAHRYLLGSEGVC